MSERFQFALEHAPPTSWHAFERLARAFLASEYKQFRPLASSSGDGGRDGLIFLAEDDETVAVQISLAHDWNDKIRRTIRRLSNTNAQVRELLYLTNQHIGPAADELRRELRSKKSVAVDIRDSDWFVDREHQTVATREAASAFCRLIVDPLLPKTEIFDRGHALLSNHESRAALLYLVMQAEDDSQDRQLTKLCFDSLVRTALRSTDNENRLSRDQVNAWVLSVLPTQDEAEVRMYVGRALQRLNKAYIRHWKASDEFCMNYEERVRLAEKVAEIVRADEAFNLELDASVRFILGGLELEAAGVDVAELVLRVRRVLEQFLFERGEAFVSSVRTGQPMLFAQSEIGELATRDSNLHPDTSHLRHNISTIVGETVERAILGLSESSNIFLRSIGDAYTLFAFMCETPDVQSAVSKLFSQGEFWLDTSAILPLLVESLLDERERRNSLLLRAVHESGAKLMVTSGVLDELLHHIELSVRAWRAPMSWRGRAPFLYSSYLWSGSPNADYLKWLTLFRGDRRPEQDLAEYLHEVHSIRVVDLKDQASRVEETVRWHAAEYWRSVHERRRPGEVTDPEIVRQLAERDLENFLGVLALRSGGEELGNPFGYRHWWLSPTRSAIEASAAIRSAAGVERLDSPVLSYDFLPHYLAVGPARRQLSKSLEQRLPMMLETSLLDATPATLLEVASSVRQQFEGQDERIIRRKIRDQLESEKLSNKRIGKAGMEAIVSELREALEAHGKRRRTG